MVVYWAARSALAAGVSGMKAGTLSQMNTKQLLVPIKELRSGCITMTVTSPYPSAFTPYFNLVWTVVLGLPVWNTSHPTVPIPKLFAEGPVLWLGVTTAVWVMECHVEEKWTLLFFVAPQKFPDQKFDSCDVPSHLEHRIVLLSVGEVKRVHQSRTNMFLPYNTCKIKEMSPNNH